MSLENDFSNFLIVDHKYENDNIYFLIHNTISGKENWKTMLELNDEIYEPLISQYLKNINQTCVVGYNQKYKIIDIFKNDTDIFYLIQIPENKSSILVKSNDFRNFGYAKLILEQLTSKTA